jgi:hypothetical protein
MKQPIGKKSIVLRTRVTEETYAKLKEKGVELDRSDCWIIAEAIRVYLEGKK